MASDIRRIADSAREEVEPVLRGMLKISRGNQAVSEFSSSINTLQRL
jgi:hypothetical protein